MSGSMFTSVTTETGRNMPQGLQNLYAKPSHEVMMMERVVLLAGFVVTGSSKEL